jgi:hypothetical protein
MRWYGGFNEKCPQGKKGLALTLIEVYLYIDRYHFMQNLNRVPPVKTAVHQRLSPMLVQTMRAQEQKQAMVVDPLMRLAEALPLLGSPSYATLRRWIKVGALRVHRASPRSHFRIRLSEIRRFRADGEVTNGAR